LKLEGKTALITGGSRGIGKATAQLFIEEGAKVVITSKNQQKLSETASEIGAFSIAGDIQNEVEVQKVVQGTAEKFGNIDILVNNAGIYVGQTPLHEVDESEWNKVIDVNLTGQFRFTKAILPYMIKNGGAIVNVSSTSGLRPSEDIGADSYGASKSALVFLTKVWALEYAKNKIRVNCVCPGIVDTDLATSFLSTPDEREQAALDHPLGRIGTPQEIAKSILFFASNESSWVTGSVLPVDGGMSAK